MSTTNEGYVDLGSPALNALRDARRAAGEAEGITETERWFMLDQAVREYIDASIDRCQSEGEAGSDESSQNWRSIHGPWWVDTHMGREGYGTEQAARDRADELRRLFAPRRRDRIFVKYEAPR